MLFFYFIFQVNTSLNCDRVLQVLVQAQYEEDNTPNVLMYYNEEVKVIKIENSNAPKPRSPPLTSEFFFQ